MRLALYQPDIPQNVGAAMRLSACLGVPLDVIEPCGFLWDERKIRQSAMDYIEHLSLSRHISWDKFRESAQGRIILLSTKAAVPYLDFQFQPGDTLLAGRESAGVPDFVHETVDARLFIPMQPGLRSLNVVNACTMVLGEALRQNGLTS
ncbi:MAG TPA: tRNA (cytidine(34)-2'-O)-methyltransferase [Alphaproteobacteria bacterium]|nr:tRNA (cytidine(34)-2'-O)-methyltransferase [Alphaproteobacteria bacterium]